MSAHAYTVDLYGAGVPVLRPVGFPGQAEIWVCIDADGTVRTLWPVRGLSVPQLERPIEPGLPSLAAILRSAVEAAKEEP